MQHHMLQKIHQQVNNHLVELVEDNQYLQQLVVEEYHQHKHQQHNLQEHNLQEHNLEEDQLLLEDQLHPAAEEELAVEAAVNPNTMQRALAELERRGLVNAQRTAGRFVTEDASALSELRKNLSEAIVAEFVHKLRSLGMTDEEILAIIEDHLARNKKEEI